MYQIITGSYSLPKYIAVSTLSKFRERSYAQLLDFFSRQLFPDNLLSTISVW